MFGDDYGKNCHRHSYYYFLNECIGSQYIIAINTKRLENIYVLRSSNEHFNEFLLCNLSWLIYLAVICNNFLESSRKNDLQGIFLNKKKF